MSISTFIYNNSPVFFQNAFCSLLGKKMVEERFNDYFFKVLSDLNESQYYTFDNIRSYKEEHLYKILEYAYNKVPFYKKFYDDHLVKPNDFKGIDDINKFPILTKELIRANYKQMLARDFDKKNLLASHTSGSSGKALDFYQTKDSLPFIWAIWWRFRNRFGVEWGDKHLNCTGKLVVPIKTKESPFWRINKPMNQWLINMQHISSEKIHDIANMIDLEQFMYFSGYPSIIYSLASLMLDKGIKITNAPHFIFTGAEKMYEDQKIVIKKIFPNVILSDHYGTSEGVVNASKCKNDIYHEDFELGHLECEEKHWLSDTEYEGDILGTSFINYGMPFIRYKIGDSAIWSTKNCSCGLHSQVITDIQGRTEDYIITPEGLKLKRFDYLFKDTIDIQECQVVQERLGHIIFRIVKRATYSLKTEQHIEKNVHEMISPTIICHFEYVSEIERTSAGKFKAVVSKLK